MRLETCRFISANFNIIQNNNPSNQYGTSTFVKNGLNVENIKCDTGGRCIVFDINDITFSNCYLHSGNDREMKQGREHYLSEVIPQLLVNKKDSGMISADFNCITDKIDSMKNPEQKISSGMKKLVSVFFLEDSYRSLFPSSKSFSRYYESPEYGVGATRIDRTYHYGHLEVKQAEYIGVPFSDHLSLVVTVKTSENFKDILSPRSRPLF